MKANKIDVNEADLRGLNILWDISLNFREYFFKIPGLSGNFKNLKSLKFSCSFLNYDYGRFEKNLLRTFLDSVKNFGNLKVQEAQEPSQIFTDLFSFSTNIKQPDITRLTLHSYLSTCCWLNQWTANRENLLHPPQRQNKNIKCLCTEYDDYDRALQQKWTHQSINGNISMQREMQTRQKCNENIILNWNANNKH